MDTVTEVIERPHGRPLTVLRSGETRGLRRVPAHLRFLAEHWPGLAAAAYAGFSEHGAGAVVVFGEGEEPRGPLRWRRSQAARPVRVRRLWYATSFDAVGRLGADWTAAWESARLDAYDPRREGLVVFVEDGAPPRGYLVSGTPPPPDALLNARALLN